MTNPEPDNLTVQCTGINETGAGVAGDDDDRLYKMPSSRPSPPLTHLADSSKGGHHHSKEFNCSNST